MSRIDFPIARDPDAFASYVRIIWSDEDSDADRYYRGFADGLEFAHARIGELEGQLAAALVAGVQLDTPDAEGEWWFEGKRVRNVYRDDAGKWRQEWEAAPLAVYNVYREIDGELAAQLSTDVWAVTSLRGRWQRVQPPTWEQPAAQAIPADIRAAMQYLLANGKPRAEPGTNGWYEWMATGEQLEQWLHLHAARPRQ